MTAVLVYLPANACHPMRVDPIVVNSASIGTLACHITIARLMNRLSFCPYLLHQQMQLSDEHCVQRGGCRFRWFIRQLTRFLPAQGILDHLSMFLQANMLLRTQSPEFRRSVAIVHCILHSYRHKTATNSRAQICSRLWVNVMPYAAPRLHGRHTR